MGNNYARVDINIAPLLLGDNFKKTNKTLLSGQNIVAGTLLGEVKFAAGSVAVGTNTGNGTVTLFALSATGKPKVGNYVLTCKTAVTNGGIFKLVDPDGITVSQDITIPAGAGANVVFVGAGITFKITDGTTDFVVGDHFTLSVTAGSYKLKQVVSTAVDGSQYPSYIAFYDKDASLADKTIDVIATGELAETKLVFSGSETIETRVDGKTYYNYLRDLGLIVLTDVVSDYTDNAE